MLFRRDLFRIFAFSLYLVAAGTPLFSQAVSVAPLQQDLTRTIKLPIEEWLDQGERTEIPWKVSLSRPLLTYQLRNLVRVTAEVPADLLQKQGISHDLHFIVKAAPERGKWESEESYSHFRVEAKLDSRAELQMLAELYLQSGVYTVATIVYDGASGKRNLSFTRVQVGAPADNALPQLLGSRPKIQDEILSPDHAMVSVADLKGRRDAGKFFQQELEQTMTQPAPCKLNFRNSFQVIAILTRGVRFPAGSDKPQIEPGCNCKVFYLQETDGSANGGGDLKNMLKPLSPTTLQFGDPQDFRQN